MPHLLNVGRIDMIKNTVKSLVLTVICVLVALLSVLPVFAEPQYSGQCGENTTWRVVNENQGWTLYIEGNGSTKVGTYVRYPDRPWNDDHLDIQIQYAVIRSGITYADYDLFYNCKNLKEIRVENGNVNYSSTDGVLFSKDGSVLVCYPQAKTDDSYTTPNTVKYIRDSAFSDCSNLTAVTLQNGVEFIGGFAFQGCSNLQNINLPASLKTICGGAFACCEKMQTISLPKNLVNFGGSRYIDDYTSLSDYSAPYCVYNNVFEECTNLQSINVDAENPVLYSRDGVLFIRINKDVKRFVTTEFSDSDDWHEEEHTFTGPHNELIKYPDGKEGSSYQIPDDVAVIWDNAFSEPSTTNVNTDPLHEITVPGSVELICNDAFGSVYNVQTFNLSEGLKYCSRGSIPSTIETVRIPHSVIDIRSAFGKWSLIKDIYYNGTKAEWNKLRVDLYYKDTGWKKPYVYVHCNDGVITVDTSIKYNSGSNENNGGGNSGNTQAPASGVSDPYSEAHNTDGSDAETVSSGNAKYGFDAKKSSSLIVGSKADVSDKFDDHSKLETYDASAKHRFTLDKKKLASINNKGILNPKKSGVVTLSYEQKVKGGKWTKIGESVRMYIQMPAMLKKDKVSLSAGDKIDAYKYLGHTTYSPTKWMSSKESVASIDDNGIITLKKKGSAQIIAIYGEGKGSTKKKYKTALKVTN